MQRARWMSGLAAGLAMAAAAHGALPSYERVTVLESPRPIADFTLVDQEGRNFEFRQLRGKSALVFFGFVHCPDVCPTTLMKLRQLVRTNSGEFADTPVVMISVDGDRDSPRQMQQYLARFSPGFIGLTGSPAVMREIGARFPAVFMKGIPASPGGAYAVQHSTLVYAIDRNGQLRAQFDDADLEAMQGVLRALAREKG